MSVSVTMPALGESVTEGTITRWLKEEGDQVKADEPLLEVSTDKVDTEIPSPVAGILAKIVVPVDETVAVGAELAVISGEGESAGTKPTEPAREQQPAPATAEPVAAQPPAQSPVAPTRQPEAGTAEGTVVTMPALGESVTEGTVTRWLKEEGDQVKADEPLLEVSTDKVDTEIPSPVAGMVLELKVAEDETVPVGAPLAVIGTAPAEAVAQPAPAPTAPPAAAEPVAPPQRPAAPPVQPAPVPQPTTRAEASADTSEGANGYVTPLVRKLAGEHGINLATLRGTGVGGRIRKQDVLDAVEKARKPAPAVPAPTATPAKSIAEPSPLRGSTVKMSRIRSVIAKRMLESLQTTAQLTTVVEVDVTKIAKLRQQAKSSFEATHGVKLSFLPFFALAAIEALRVYPTINATMDEAAGTITYPEAEHLGIAVDTEKGLMVPVIHEAGDLNLAGLAKRISDLAARTRDNKVTPDELSGGTFTLTNTGSRGALFDTPILNRPQSAMLGTGAVVKRAVVMDDPELGEVIAPRSMMYLALSYDHRLIDGADAARFLATVKERLESGNFEADLGL